MRQNPTEYGVEASWLTSNEEIQLVFCGKVMLTPFCDSEEPLLEDYMEKGCMIYIQYKIQCFANHQTETSNSPEMPKPNAKERFVVPSQCPPPLTHICPEVLEYPAYSQDLNSSNAKKIRKIVDLLLMMRRKCCINGCMSD